jgi:hypothetical protein
VSYRYKTLVSDLKGRTHVVGVHENKILRNVSGAGGFGGLEVACWPLVPKFAGSHPAEAVGFLGRKNPQHAFFWRGSKAVGPMS